MLNPVDPKTGKKKAIAELTPAEAQHAYDQLQDSQAVAKRAGAAPDPKAEETAKALLKRASAGPDPAPEMPKESKEAESATKASPSKK